MKKKNDDHNIINFVVWMINRSGFGEITQHRYPFALSRTLIYF